MKYNLNNLVDKEKFKIRCNKLFEDGEYVELRKINQNRSIPQNSYLHLLLGLFALEYGDTIDYVKEEIFKKQVNKEIFEGEFTNRKTGEIRIGWRSTAALDTAEMTLAIDRFRDWSAKEAGIYLPTPNERDFLKEAEIQMERTKQYI